jgi:hypothetical protein
MPTPQNGVNGSDQLVYIMSDDPTPVQLEVEYQGDATFDTGVKQELKRVKNGTLPYRTKDGATLSFSVIKTRPLSLGQARLWDVAASGELVEVIFDDPNSGGHKRSGYAQISMGAEKANKDELIEPEFTVAWVDEPTEVVNA